MTTRRAFLMAGPLLAMMSQMGGMALRNAAAEARRVLVERAAAAWDVIVSADTLVYFGDLRQTLHAAAQALKPRGWLGFTLENLDVTEDRVQLAPSGRYQHSRRHVEAALGEAGLELVSIQADSLRKEVGLPVPGWVVIARRVL